MCCNLCRLVWLVSALFILRSVGILSFFFLFVYCRSCRFFRVRHNGLQLQEVGGFGDENCLPPQNLIRSTMLHLTTEPPISCRCCYLLALLFLSFIIFSLETLINKYITKEKHKYIKVSPIIEYIVLIL